MQYRQGWTPISPDIKNFRERSLLFVDLEFTGLDPRINEIVEVGAILVDGKTLEVKKEYEAKVKPLHIENADPVSLQINGYKKENWKQAKSIKTVLRDLNKMAPHGVIAGWNVTYDWMFLEMAYRNNNIKPAFDYHKLDVLAIAYAYALKNPEIREVKLSALVEHFKIQRKEIHRAFADIKATYEVFMKLIA